MKHLIALGTLLLSSALPNLVFAAHGGAGPGGGGLHQALRFESGQNPKLQLRFNISDSDFQKITITNPSSDLDPVNAYLLKMAKKPDSQSIAYIGREGTRVISFLYYGGYSFPSAKTVEPNIDSKFEFLRKTDLDDHFSIRYRAGKDLTVNGERVAAVNSPEDKIISYDDSEWLVGDDCPTVFKNGFAVNQCQAVSATLLGGHERLSLAGLEGNDDYRYSISLRYLLHSADSTLTGDLGRALKLGIVKYYGLDTSSNVSTYSQRAVADINGILGRTRNKDVINALLDLRKQLIPSHLDYSFLGLLSRVVSRTPVRPDNNIVEETCSQRILNYASAVAANNQGFEPKHDQKMCPASIYEGPRYSPTGSFYIINVNCATPPERLSGFDSVIVKVDSPHACNILE